MEGTVKFFNPRKNYGFVEVEGEDDHFVHESEVPDDIVLEEGDRVSFESAQGDKGLKATNVELVEEGDDDSVEAEL